MFYIRLRGEQQGPFEEEQLIKLFARGRFGRHYEVSVDGVHWSRADRYPELFPKPPPRQKTPQNQEIKLAEAVPRPADNDGPQVEWYYTRGDAELGPVAASEMRRLVEVGQVQPSDYVWCEGMSNWLALRDVPELARLLAGGSHAGESAGIQNAPMAVASFVLGLLGATVLPLLGSVLAIVFGHVAQRQIHKSQGKMGGKGLAIAGLILGYLVLVPAVIVLIVFVAIMALAPSGTAVG